MNNNCNINTMANGDYFNIMNAVLTVRDVRDRAAKLVDALDDIADFVDLQLLGEQDRVMKQVLSNMKAIVNYTALREEYDCKRILDICEEDEDREKWLDGKINAAIGFFIKDACDLQGDIHSDKNTCNE